MQKTMRDMLLLELKTEIAKTRKMLEALPDDQESFKPHEKSMTLGLLANHTATLAGVAAPILTHDAINMGTPEDPRRIIRANTKAERMQAFSEVAAASEAAMGETTDEALAGEFTLLRQGTAMFTNTRYFALRNLSLNHMVHHRAQLGTYLRQLNLPVPGMFGPSADEK